MAGTLTRRVQSASLAVVAAWLDPVRRIILWPLAVALWLAGCDDGIKLNNDNAMRKPLTGTPLAFVRSGSDLPLDMELVREHGANGVDDPLLPERNGFNFECATVAWDSAFVVGTRARYDQPRKEPGNARVAWFVIDLSGSNGPRLVYEGEDKAAYDAARSRIGIKPDLLPRPFLHYWPNWDGSPQPWDRADVAPELDPETGVGSTSRLLPVGKGYFVQDAIRTFLWLSKDSPNPSMDRTPVPLTRRTSDVFRIAWNDRFIVADVCFLESDGCSEPTVDRTMPVGCVVVDTKTGRASNEINRRSVAKLRRKFGVPDALQPRDVVLVWPDWPEIRRPWRKDPETMKYLGLE